MEQDLTRASEEPQAPMPFTNGIWRSLSDTERNFIMYLIEYYEWKSKEPKPENVESLAELDRPIFVEESVVLTEGLLVKIGKALQGLIK